MILSRFGIEGWLQADPGENSALVEFAQGVDAIAGQLCAALPLQADDIVERRQRGGERIAGRAKQIDVSQGPAAALRQDADAQSVCLQQLNDLARERVVAGMIRVSRERQHDLLCDARRLVFAGVAFEPGQKIPALDRARVKRLAGDSQNPRHIAIRALMATAPIGVGGERGVLSGLPRRSVDDGAPAEAHTILVEDSRQWPASTPAVYSGGGGLRGAGYSPAFAAHGLGRVEQIDLFWHYIISLIWRHCKLKRLGLQY